MDGGFIFKLINTNARLFPLEIIFRIMVHTAKAFGVDSVNDLLQKDINAKAVSVAKFREPKELKEPKQPKSAKEPKEKPPKPAKESKTSASSMTSVLPPPPKPIEKVLPPPFHVVELSFPESILWQRIQLREFLLRFGPLLSIDTKHVRRLDDVQHAWSHDFANAVVTATLKAIASDDFATGVEPLIGVDAAIQAFKEVTKPSLGITDRGWHAVAELLKLEGLDDVPEGSLCTSTTQPTRVTRGVASNPAPRVIPTFSEHEQLALINLLCEAALSTDLLRREIATAPDSLRAHEESLKKELKLTRFQESLDNGARKSLTMVLKELQGRKDRAGIEKAERELKVFEEEVAGRRRELEGKKVELMRHEEKLARRVGPLGRDVRGNVYWRFGNVMGGKRSFFKSSWGQCLVVVGRGCGEEEGRTKVEGEHVEDREEDSKFWFVQGSEDVEWLRKWVEYEAYEKWGPKKKKAVRKKTESAEEKKPDPAMVVVIPEFEHEEDGEAAQHSFVSDESAQTVELDFVEVPRARGGGAPDGRGDHKGRGAKAGGSIGGPGYVV
ncbi:hypothetical protein BC938DRAFT_477065 [Jimgerdemannia flammicorona]|uniref:Uncharacterized protein n=1 Tax=Jimgerdemannia flammicorona TaxID=994334 RepID=A0A433PC98_9FUNG|nr:hypothetical protein BC938DRAFT_477065 [Jimgerdemannia flammicorona]